MSKNNARDKELMKQSETECGFDPDKFADLIRADEREQCAKLCEETAQRLFEEGKQYEAHGADICADMIRAQNSKETT